MALSESDDDDSVLVSWTELGASAKGDSGAKPSEWEAAQAQKTQETLCGLVEQMGTLRALVEQSARSTATNIETIDSKLQEALDNKAAYNAAELQLMATEASFFLFFSTFHSIYVQSSSSGS